MTAILTEYGLLLPGVLAAGFLAGFAGGLFGIGGGIVTVPALYAVFKVIGFDSAGSIKTAIGTSLAVIIITSLRSLLAHHREGHVDGDLLRAWAPWIALGSIAGGLAAKWVPAEVLTVVFATGALFIAWRRLAPKKAAEIAHHDLLRKRIKIPVSMVTGFSAAIMGLGGGAVGVLVMTASGRTMHQAVATAAGFGMAVAAPGLAGFVISGWNAAGLPPGSLGYFNWPAFLAMAITAAVAAPIGAKLAHRTDAVMLSRLFGVYVLLAAIGMFADLVMN